MATAMAINVNYKQFSRRGGENCGVAAVVRVVSRGRKLDDVHNRESINTSATRPPQLEAGMLSFLYFFSVTDNSTKQKKPLYSKQILSGSQ